jgi:hypothetical protein
VVRFQEPDEGQLLHAVDAGESNRIGHEETAKNICLCASDLVAVGRNDRPPGYLSPHALLAGIGFGSKSASLGSQADASTPANVSLSQAGR